MSIRNQIKQILTEKENKRYGKQLKERCMSYGQWAAKQENTTKKYGRCIFEQAQEACGEKSEAAGTGLSDGGEEKDESGFVIFCMPDGRLADGAEEAIAYYFTVNPQVQLAYGDEDVWETVKQAASPCSDKASGAVNARRCPWFKPDWSPNLLDTYYYLGSVIAMRRSFLEEYPCPVDCVSDANLLYIPARETDVFAGWICFCTVVCGGRMRGCNAIGHIDRVLFHCDAETVINRYRQDIMYSNLASDVANNSCTSPLENADKIGCSEGKRGLLSIIIPSKDNPEILEKCLAGITTVVLNAAYEIIIVDNGSSPENKRKVDELVDRYTKGYDGTDGYRNQDYRGISYVYEPQEFNFSKMCNLGAQNAGGSLLLFLNDDVELCNKGCLEWMAELALQGYVGAVGLKLYYPDSTKIQHAGITNLPMGPVHKLQFLDDEESYYFGANRGLRNVLAVTAACLMVEKKKFQEAGGFSEELRVAFNDVDFCFSLYELGYQNVCCNNIYAYHHESLSRGADESTEKWQRLMVERDKLYERHPKLEGVDPYYGVGLGRDGLDTRIRPAYETAGNFLQFVKCNSEAVGKYSRLLDATGEAGIGGKSSAKRKSTSMEAISQKKFASYRQDNCLLVRVENCRDGVLQGYGVVLGDNNACYDKWLVLEPVVDSEVQPALSSQNAAYMIKIDGQYRPDLVENMPDQKNVGLSGFWMETPQQDCGEYGKGKLPSGSYRIGMAARNRVTGLKLINFSTRMVEIPS